MKTGAQTHKRYSLSYVSNQRLFWIVFGLLLIYYVADSAMDSFIFGQEPFIEQLFSPTPHELAIRILSGAFLFAFSLYVKQLLIKNQSLQDQLLQQTQELINSTLEREAFTYAFSHEMRTSLTCIYLAEQTFSEQYNHQLEENGQELINQIHSTCEKMSGQIDNMLDLSNVLRAKLNRQRVELNKLVLDVASEIRSSSDDMTVSVDAENKMITYCDPELMRLAIKSLCMSIVECCKPSRNIEISVGTAESEGGRQTFFFRNKGYLSKPVDPNKQPLLASVLPKAGGVQQGHVCIDLVTAVISRHGGKVWCENSPDIGTTVFFSI